MASNPEDTNWRLDNTIEPFKMITDPPDHPIPSLLSQPNPIDEKRMVKIKKTTLPNSGQDFWKNIYAGGFGTADPNLLSPSFEKLLGKFSYFMIFN